MKQFFTLLLICFGLTSLQAQVAISNPASAPDASAMLDVKSANKGFLMPRVTNRTNVPSPATGLLVYETASNAVWVYNGTAWVQLGSSAGASQWITSGTHIYNGNTGNVGIGISVPTAKLHLAGLMKIDGGQIDIDDNIAQVRLIDGGSPKGYFKLSGSSGNIVLGTNVGANDIGKLQLETKSFPRLTILPDGNVGIGHINPTEKLYVNGNIRTTARVDAEGVIEGAGLSSTGTLYVSGTSLLGGNLTASSAATVYGSITTNTGVTINDAAGTLGFKTSGDDKGFVQLSGDNLRVGTYSGNTTGKFVVRTGGTDQVYVDQNGNMGFNVSTPLSRLQILTGDDASISSHGYLMLGSVTGSNLIFDNNEIMARSNGAVGNLVLQNDGGTVRIGSVAVPSGYKFAINGKMYCEELRVKLSANWPDYVFKKNYNLMPLADLQNFIQQNNHLPNIPKASTIEKEGLEVGDMQKKLMEKVEELTLYILDLQKQIDEVKAAKITN